MPLKNHFIYFFLLLAIPNGTAAFEIIEKSETVPHSTEAEAFCFFLPPQGWDIADPRTLSPRVQVAFIKKKSEGFCPSLNLAVEKVEISQSEYLKIVKNIQESDRNNQWRHLGKVHTAAGVAELTEIDTKTEWGPIRMLQLILVKNTNAYVLTAAALKSEIAQLYKDFQKAFRSLQVTEDLVNCIPQMERRETLKQAESALMIAWDAALIPVREMREVFADKSFQEAHWLPFQKTVISNYEDMGAHWQILFLKAAQQKLFAKKAPSLLPLDPSPIETEAIQNLEQTVDQLEEASETSLNYEAVIDSELATHENPLEEIDAEISEEQATIEALTKELESLDINGSIQENFIEQEPLTQAGSIQENFIEQEPLIQTLEVNQNLDPQDAMIEPTNAECENRL